MMFRTAMYLLVLLTAACNSSEDTTEEGQALAQVKEIDQWAKAVISNSDEGLFHRDSVIGDRPTDFALQFDATPNPQDSSISDTIISVKTKAGSEWRYYKVGQQEFLISAQIRDSNIVLDEVRVGMPKLEFLSIFGDEHFLDDSLIIESTNQHDFIKIAFKNDKVDAIIIEHYFD